MSNKYIYIYGNGNVGTKNGIHLANFGCASALVISCYSENGFGLIWCQVGKAFEVSKYPSKVLERSNDSSPEEFIRLAICRLPVFSSCC